MIPLRAATGKPIFLFFVPMTQKHDLDPRNDEALDSEAENSLTDAHFVNTNDLAVPEEDTEDESDEYSAL